MAEQMKLEVSGLREFNRALKRFDAQLPKAVRIALNEATEVVIDYAVPRIPSRTGRARASLKARSTRTEARVRGGGARAAYYGWLDFGGQGRIAGRPAARPFLREGRYLWKALRERRVVFSEKLSQALTQVGRDAGMQVD